MAFQVRHQASRLRRHRRGRTSGQHPWEGTGRRRGRRGTRGRLRCLLDDDVRVGATDAERGHPGAAGPSHVGPLLAVGQECDLTGRPVDVRAGRVDVQRGGQDAVPHRHHHLDDAGHAGGGLGVPHVRLDRPEPQRPAGLATLAVGGQQRLRFDRVSQHGAGAVSLDGVHVGRADARIGERSPHHPLLGRAVGRGQAVGRTVLVDGDASHHSEDGMPEPLGIGEPLQRQHAASLGPSDTVGRTRVRLAPAVGRQAAVPAELDEDRRRRVDGDPARQREVALSGPQ